MIFTEDEVRSLNEYQKSNIFHPFTCTCKNNLVATTDGWVCECTEGIYQTWAHQFMKNWKWKELEWDNG